MKSSLKLEIANVSITLPNGSETAPTQITGDVKLNVDTEATPEEVNLVMTTWLKAIEEMTEKLMKS